MLGLIGSESVFGYFVEITSNILKIQKKIEIKGKLFQGVGTKTVHQHFFQINETGHMQAKTDVFLMFKIECSRGNL